MKNKKGVSPIIAAVILIAIVVAVGALVANFIRDYVDTQQESVESREGNLACATDVTFEVLASTAGIKGTCVSDVVENVRIQNGGVEIIGMTASVLGPDEVASATIAGITVAAPLVPSAILQVDIDPGTTLLALGGSIDKIILTPKIQVGEKEIVCSEAGVEIFNAELEFC